MIKGINVNRIIEGGRKSTTYVKESVIFENDLERYIEKFKKLVSDGSILNESFYENTWDIQGEEYCHDAVFDFEFKTELNNAFKCYFLIMLNDRLLLAKCAIDYLNALKRMCIQTCFFNIKFIEVVIQSIMNFSLSGFYRNLLIEFLTFYSYNDYKEFIGELKKITCINKAKVRNLPDYKSILMFSELLETYINESDFHGKLKYYPIYLWFRITAVIPMRTVEFRKLRVNCCYFDEDRDGYFMKVVRSKEVVGKITSNYQIPILRELQVTKELFEMINDFRKLVDAESKEKYLVSYSFFQKFFIIKRKPRTKFLIEGRISHSMMSKMLEDFYSEIVKGKYGYYVIHKDKAENMEDNVIQMLSPMDTRHLAFCNMLLMGYNPLTIAQMGGHTKLNSQNTYFSHIGNFLETHTMLLAKKMLSVNRQQNVSEINGKTSREIYIKDYFKDGESNRLVENNKFLCYSKDFPYECTESTCFLCQHSKLNTEVISYEDYYQELLKESKSVHTQIEIQREVLEKCYKDVHANGNICMATKTCSDIAQEQLKSESGKLNHLSYRLAVVEARINAILKEYLNHEKSK